MEETPIPLYLEPSDDWRGGLPFAGASLLVHALMLAVFVALPDAPVRRDLVRRDRTPPREVTKLYAPKLVPTQVDPNPDTVTPNITSAGLLTSQAAAAARGRALNLPVSGPPGPAGRPVEIEAPPAAVSGNPVAGSGTGTAVAGTLARPPLDPPPPAKPKLVLESVRAANASPNPGSGLIPPAPSASVADATRGAAGGSGGRPSSGAPAQESALGTVAGPQPARLLSDPQGVDFRNWLAQVHLIVERNWKAVIPDVAMRGRTGQSVLQFAVRVDGRISKLVIAGPSGADPLDRAAVAGLSASDPLPPLPAGFRGPEVRLQMTFTYKVR